MYTIQENLRPLVDKYDQWLNGFYLSGLLQFKAQKQVGGDYISKVFKAQAHQINVKYEDALTATQNPTFKGFLKDNFFRLVALNCVERLVSAAQAATSLTARAGRPNTLSFLFTEIMNDGAFKGTLRGLSFNFLQTSLVLWPSVVLTNKTKGGIVEFLTSFLVFDAILYPLDTIKNVLYANTVVPKGVRQAVGQVGIANAYKGLVSKAIFNVPYASALYFTAQGNDLALPAWLATFLLYPFYTNKTSLQVAGVQSFGYRGLVPFALVNLLFGWQLSALYGPEKLESVRKGVIQQSIHKLGYY